MSQSPYSPTEPISDPARLIGRHEFIVAAIDAIGAGRNLIVTGERGVGKSSFSMVLLSILSGRRRIKDRSVKRAVVAVFSCSPGETLLEVTDGLLRSLSRCSGRELTTVRRSGIEIGGTLGAMSGSRTWETETKEAASCAARIVDSIATLRRAGLAPSTPIVAVVDEVDQLSTAALPGVLVRTSKEMIAAESLGLVSFVLVGQKRLVSRLRSEHPSAPRAFEQIWLDPLSSEACESIVRDGESISGVEFDSSIRSVIAKSSRGFPAVVQRLADSCFRADRDQFVDTLDFEVGLRAAIDQIKGEETLQSASALSGQPGRRIISMLAVQQDSVPLRTIQQVLSDSNEMVASSVDVLEEGGVIERDGDGYRLVDRLVAAYVTLEETRTRATLEVKELAAQLHALGWSVRAMEPEELRGIDLVASSGRWIFRRRVGVLYVGTSDRLSDKGIRHMRPQFKSAEAIYGLDEIWIVGHGNASQSVYEALEEERGVVYFDWDHLKLMV
ncbi:AAA family ATPase [Dokdonella immobilis]|uniref:AAA domain-containing protein n=1 Tax=Dokdonella immobilis TaxID=578942 RepID=A0A1I4XYU3_9GAMM|nr:AAA family ATPase [Dokdonella immobilis]SFN31081.1 AAA domain-containing protein [Dokdonella immobilis]